MINVVSEMENVYPSDVFCRRQLKCIYNLYYLVSRAGLLRKYLFDFLRKCDNTRRNERFPAIQIASVTYAPVPPIAIVVAVVGENPYVYVAYERLPRGAEMPDHARYSLTLTWYFIVRLYTRPSYKQSQLSRSFSLVCVRGTTIPADLSLVLMPGAT